MKKCTMKNCSTPVENQLFNKNKRKKDGLSNVCRDCGKREARLYYENNREKHIKAVRVNKRSQVKVNQENLLLYVTGKQCLDCQQTDTRTFEFDHIKEKGHKVNDISRMIQLGCSWESILNEIHKCELVCANCHRIRTFERNKSYRTGSIAKME